MMEQEITKIELLNTQSEEIQEVIGKEPSFVIRWGIFSVFCLIVLSIVLAFIIEYNETIISNISFVSKKQPVKVIALSDGKIKELFVSEGSVLKEGELIAYLETIASAPQVFKLRGILEKQLQYIINNDFTKLQNFEYGEFSKLGELQTSFQTFMAAFIPLKFFALDSIYVKKKSSINQQLASLSVAQIIIEEQKNVYKGDYAISVSDFEARKTLYNDKVIPLLEFQQEKSKLLLKELPLLNSNNSLVSIDRDIGVKKYELVDLDQQLNNYKVNFLNATNTLLEAIKQWDKQFVFRASVSGVVSMPTLLYKNKQVKVNDEIVFVHQPNSSFYGESRLSQQNFGKIQLGQKVFVKVDGYPFQEFGKLNGSVYFIAKNADANNQYYVAINFLDSLNTDKHIKLNVQNGMTGTIEIVTKRTKLINKFIYSIVELIDAAKNKKNIESKTQ
jgi:multidrug resistance efflux pump